MRRQAIFLHNYRGECELIRTSDGHEESPPFGMSSEFITGGGPQPLGLTEKARQRGNQGGNGQHQDRGVETIPFAHASRSVQTAFRFGDLQQEGINYEIMGAGAMPAGNAIGWRAAESMG